MCQVMDSSSGGGDGLGGSCSHRSTGLWLQCGPSHADDVLLSAACADCVCVCVFIVFTPCRTVRSRMSVTPLTSMTLLWRTATRGHACRVRQRQWQWLVWEHTADGCCSRGLQQGGFVRGGNAQSCNSYYNRSCSMIAAASLSYEVIECCGGCGVWHTQGLIP